MLKIITLSLFIINCESLNVYSSFWAPLYDRRILNYKVEANFDPAAGTIARETFKNKYGFRGQNLIADLGNGRGFGDRRTDDTIYGDVKSYYTYPGADGRPIDM